MVPIKQKLQPLRILLQKPKTRTNRMEMPKMPKKIHDRDINATKNIRKQGLIDLIDEAMNLWDRGDSTVILLSIESTGP